MLPPARASPFMLTVAVPEALSDTEARVVLPSKKMTLPRGIAPPAADLTVAVRVVKAVCEIAAGDALAVVAVGCKADTTEMDAPAVDPAKLAVIVLAPDASLLPDTVNVAMEPIRGAVPIVVPPAVKLTVPVLAGFTVATSCAVAFGVMLDGVAVKVMAGWLAGATTATVTVAVELLKFPVAT